MAVAIHHSLDGINVLELGASRSIKLTGMILRDLGSSVLRLGSSVPSEEDSSLIYDRSKMVIAASECSSSEIIDALLHRTDIVIDDANCQDPVIESIRNRYSQSKQCIICSIKTDAEEGVALHEEATGAVSGLYDTPSGMGFPRSYALPIASTATAFYSVNALVMALIGRKRYGTGYTITIPVEKVVYSMQIIIAMIRSNPPLHWEPFRWLASPFTGLYKAKDNQYIYIHVAMPRHLRNFLFMLDSSGFKVEKALIKKLLHKETKLDPMVLKSLRESLKISKVLETLFRKENAGFWEELLSTANLCCARMRNFDEWRNHPQVIESGELVPLTGTDGNMFMVPGKLIKSSSGDGIALNHSEQLSINDIISRWTEKKALNETTGESTLPLQGLKVIDLSRIIAGPVTGKSLADFGADVIHLSIRKNLLSWEEPFHVAFNAGKKSVVVDCSRPGGRDELLRIIRQINPDVIVHNYLDKAVEKLGIDYESMKQINPEIIYLNINGYNPDGPWKIRPGFEQCVQAASGILQTYSAHTTPQILPMPFIDMSTGIISSLAVALSYLQKLQGNGGNHVSTSLTPSAIYLQMDRLVSTAADTEGVNPSGFYRARDTVFYLSVKQHAVSTLAKLFTENQSKKNMLNRDALSTAFRKYPVAVWKSKLSKVDMTGNSIQMVTYVSMKTILSNELKKKTGLFVFSAHEMTGNVLTCRSPVCMSPQGTVALSPAEPPGKSSSDLEVHQDFFPELKQSQAPNNESRLKRIKWYLHQVKWIMAIIMKGRALKR
jgi:crotonobetainyl-CoA:carnitine CoA-transferase CaiB-like acyl-CoA transferase